MNGAGLREPIYKPTLHYPQPLHLDYYLWLDLSRLVLCSSLCYLGVDELCNAYSVVYYLNVICSGLIPSVGVIKGSGSATIK